MMQSLFNSIPYSFGLSELLFCAILNFIDQMNKFIDKSKILYKIFRNMLLVFICFALTNCGNNCCF